MHWRSRGIAHRPPSIMPVFPPDDKFFTPSPGRARLREMRALEGVGIAIPRACLPRPTRGLRRCLLPSVFSRPGPFLAMRFSSPDLLGKPLLGHPQQLP